MLGNIFIINHDDREACDKTLNHGQRGDCK